MITASGTFILGLSWLIGTTAQEVRRLPTDWLTLQILLSCIYLFVKHPYDVADRVDIDGNAYVVKEMHLLSTIFRGVDGKIMQMPHTLLNTKVITNIRRSGPISEPFPFDVSFDTPWDKIVALRDRMYAFVETETRDFLPKLCVHRSFTGADLQRHQSARLCGPGHALVDRRHPVQDQHAERRTQSPASQQVPVRLAARTITLTMQCGTEDRHGRAADLRPCRRRQPVARSRRPDRRPLCAEA